MLVGTSSEKIQKLRAKTGCIVLRGSFPVLKCVLEEVK